MNYLCSYAWLMCIVLNFSLYSEHCVLLLSAGWQDYLTNDNDQAVVEICITRITTAIRETGSIERHSTALVGLWESCLEHNLTPQGENTEDTPHAKIASDITSCILQVSPLTHTHAHLLFFLFLFVPKHLKVETFAHSHQQLEKWSRHDFSGICPCFVANEMRVVHAGKRSH